MSLVGLVLLNLINVRAGKILRAEKWDELAVCRKRRVGPEICRDFLCFVLLHLCPGSFK